MTEKQFLKEVLMQKDVCEAIKENLDELICLIPEIKDAVGFDHQNPAHMFDVWGHTLYALGLSKPNFIVRCSLLFHDLAKPQSAVRGRDGYLHYSGHQAKSSEIAKRCLTNMGFNQEEIEKICYIIALHDNYITDDEVKENPNLQKLRLDVQICDAFAHTKAAADRRIDYLNDRKKYIKNFLKNMNKKTPC